ncbi:unnamed protein product [Rhizopus stolonifer]
MTSEGMVRKLNGVYNHLNAQLTVYPKLLSMHGRLGLIQRQINYRNRVEDESEDEEDIKVFSDSEDDGLEDDDISDEDDEDDEDSNDLMDLDNEATMFAEEEEDYLNTEDEEDLSESELEE